MKNKKKIIVLILFVATATILFLWLGFKVNWSLGCLAYYDQCTAERLHGLTDQECFKKDDPIAYLIDQNICLVVSVAS